MAETRVLPPSSNPPTVAAKTDENAVENRRAPRMANMGRASKVVAEEEKGDK